MQETTSRPTKTAPTLWREIAFWSLIAAIFLVPAWVTFGRILFGVGGWYILIFMLTVLPVLVLYHLIVEALAWFGPEKRMVSKRAAITLFVYYGAILVFGLSIVDFGDAENSIYSALTVLGVPVLISHILSAISAIVAVGSAIALIVFLVMDIIKARRPKTVSGK